ncbi:MAG: type II toxin-antitoxin system Phd/YefM family antitoxin [Coriobacteriia bacterium]|nr:type II toxin-antitoxin system Phd/YefM family antitoxin [Coriobacteriia bacterium]
MEAAVKFSEDIIPLTALKVNPGKVVKQLDQTRRPALLTNHGKGVAVMQDLAAYEQSQEERRFLRDVVKGLADLEAGREISLDELEIRLGLAR